MPPECNKTALTHFEQGVLRLIPRTLFILWRVCAALGILLLTLGDWKTSVGLGAVEPMVSGGASNQSSFAQLPKTTADPDVSKLLEEALHRELQRTNSGPLRTNAPVLPRQLILAPGSASELASSNILVETLHHELNKLNDAERRARLLPGPLTNSIAPTNGPVFDVKGYEVVGNTLLAPDLTTLVLEPYTGPKVTFGTIREALTDLQKIYSDRGFSTVLVNLPQQTLSNGIVQVRVIEGTLSGIMVVNNHHFGSNNVMRALPSLHTNMILNSYLFQAELDRANANQDRQIYPQIEPGVEPGTADLRLQVKDRFPLHAKIELNDQNSPGTPDLRLNSSAVYGNLWQLEHSVGVQYSFSPEAEKVGNQWDFYDTPRIANYSAFYRMPLATPGSVAEETANSAGNFGYDEATRRFNLPPSSGQPELNIYASRSTIDTGIENLINKVLYDTNSSFLRQQSYQQDLTVNNVLGTRLSTPLWASGGFQSTISGGLDYKTYQLSSYKTNIFTLQNVETVTQGGVTSYITNNSVDISKVPPTIRPLDYLPLSMRCDTSLRDSLGTTFFGLGLSGNLWFSGTVGNIHNVTGSSQSSGHWVVITPSVGRDFILYTNWTLSWRLDGQFATEPVLANEQFGAGGVASVPGYHEGEVFGDEGFHTGLELKSPTHLIGLVNGKQPLTIRGSAYMDYAEVYLLDPQGRPGNIPLWSTGIGAVAACGTHWEARLLFSVPLDGAPATPRDELRFNFAISAQF